MKSSGDKYDKIDLLEKEFAKKMPIKFLKRDLNKSKVRYVIEKKRDISIGNNFSEIRPSLLCKGLGVNAAIELEKNQPYNSLKELAEKTDSSIVDIRCIDALIEAGYFGRGKKKSKEDIIKEFATIREDLKKANKKGIDSSDIFG
jgi:DNA polymerase III alpha subunit